MVTSKHKEDNLTMKRILSAVLALLLTACPALADEFSVAVDSARELCLYTADGAQLTEIGAIPLTGLYLAGGESVSFSIDSDAALDVYTNYGGGFELLEPADGLYTAAVDSAETTGYESTAVLIYPADAFELPVGMLLLFPSEAAIDAFCASPDGVYDSSGAVIPGVTWSYPLVQYTLRVVDQNGAPVPKVAIVYCDESTCNPIFSDENGVASFQAPAYPYSLHTLNYHSTPIDAPAGGGEVTIVVEIAEE